MSCPVCGHSSYKEIYSTSRPASVTELPTTKEESLNMTKYQMDFVQCDNCTHVYNRSFLPNTEMYHGAGCTMYNNGSGWQAHIRDQRSILHNFIEYPQVIEIGAGDGSFLAGLRQHNKIAYEPSDDYYLCIEKGLQAVHDYFVPSRDMPPPGSLLIMRHVLEHLQHPRDFIEDLVNNTDRVDFFVEVPCIEKALKLNRVEDWVYEHPQHFTRESLEYLMGSLGWEPMIVSKVYGDEVLIYYGKYTRRQSRRTLPETIIQVKSEFDLLRQRDQIVFWGGAGKSAMFLHEFSSELDVVVDSDSRKFGRYVPGLSLEIKDPAIIEDNSVIVITTYWRASDILAEIRTRNIQPKVVYVYSDGGLVEIYRPLQEERNVKA